MGLLGLGLGLALFFIRNLVFIGAFAAVVFFYWLWQRMKVRWVGPATHFLALGRSLPIFVARLSRAQELDAYLQRDREPWGRKGHMLMEPSTKQLSIVMPAYNEEKRLAKTLDTTLKYLGAPDQICSGPTAAEAQCPLAWCDACPVHPDPLALPLPRPTEQRRGREPLFTYEVVVVNDGSKDKTAQVATDYMNKHGRDTIRLINYPDGLNRGKVRAGAVSGSSVEKAGLGAEARCLPVGHERSPHCRSSSSMFEPCPPRLVGYRDTRSRWG